MPARRMVVLAHQVGKQQDQRKFADLGRLEVDRADTDPPSRAALGLKQVGHHAQADRRKIQRPHKFAQPVIVDKGCSDHAGDADDRPSDLTADVVKAAAHIVIGAGIACRKQHDQSKTQQRQHQQQKRHIKVAPDIEGGFLCPQAALTAAISGFLLFSGRGAPARVGNYVVPRISSARAGDAPSV